MEMMKMRQQPDSSYMNKIIKQKALFLHNSRGGQINYKHEGAAGAGLINMMRGNNYGVDYERDESPVSVISHSVSVISQPSSACTSMEHHLLLSPPSINPNPDPNHSCANSHYAYKTEQFSVGTSAASTSEDDSSAYHLPTLFFEVAPLQEEISNAQQGSAKEDNLRNNSGEEELDTQQTSAKPIKRKSLINSETTNSVGPSLKSCDDDDELMISIDFQGDTGWQEINSSTHRERFIKGSEKKLSKEEEEKQAGDKPITILEQNDERKRDQKLERSTSHCQAAPVVEPTKFHNTGERATSHVGRYEAESLKGSQPAQRSVNVLTQKAPPSLAFRQKSINSTKSSKWDDAEKWLCYDNHVSRHHKVRHSSLSTQKWDSDNDSTSDRFAHSVSKASNEHKDNHASLSRRNLDGSKVYEHRGPKDDVAFGSGAYHLVMQNTNVTPSRGSLSSDVMSRSKHACAPQSANPNGFVKNKMLEDDNVKRNWFEANLGTCRKGDFGYMSNDEVVYPHLLSNKLPAITANDGEIYANNASNYETYHVSQMSMSSGSISGEDSKKKDRSFKASFVRWKKDSLDESVAYARRVRECDYLSSGELLSQANNRRKLVAISTSDGEMYANYASYQQHKNNVSYAQRLKHHQLLQKLRKKCSPSNGGRNEMVQHVREDGAQNFVGINAYGGVVSASRLSIPMQASSSKDQFWTQGEYGRTQSVGKQEIKVARDESVCITTTGMQREFVVQTPIHGRSASMKDACTEVSPTVSRRDMGTQMTPSESSPFASKCTSPMQNTSPARHNTPARLSPPLNSQINYINIDTKDDIDISEEVEDKINSSTRRPSCGNAMELESCHWAKLELRDLPPVGQTTFEKNGGFDSVYSEWSPGVCVEGEIAVDEGDHENDAIDEEVHAGGLVQRLSALDARAAAWEGAERAKFHAKFKREEARINAWETLQKAKAQAELKKLEVKLERLRSKATEKVLSKVAAAERRAEEMRAAAEVQQAEQMRKVRERACNLRKTALFPGSFAVCFARNYMP